MPKHTRSESLELQRKALALAEKGLSNEEIASKLKVNVRTIQRWMPVTPTQQIVKSITQNNPQNIRALAPSQEVEPSKKDELDIPTFQKKIDKLVSLSLTRLECFLVDPETTPVVALKAIEVIGSWSALNKGIGCSANIAINLIQNLGYKVIDPSIVIQDSNQQRGLTDTIVAEIKQKLLGFSESDDLSLDADVSLNTENDVSLETNVLSEIDASPKIDDVSCNTNEILSIEDFLSGLGEKN